jgi:peptidoglycan hydrolase-like protein with peptidoglycan-binding domain
MSAPPGKGEDPDIPGEPMAKCDIPRIDALLDGQGLSFAAGETDRDAVGAVQDLLLCHGAEGLPGLLSPAHGAFGPLTTRRIREFQAAAALAQTGTVDAATLRELVARMPIAPRVSQAYVTLVLDFAWSGTTRLVTLTTQFEGAGRFAAANRNHDKAGLSFGLIQWAQRPGRLNELLKAFRQGAPAQFTAIFGLGDAVLADGLIAHTGKAGGGADANGLTTDPRYDLLSEAWLRRFAASALDLSLQKIQFALAIDAFRRSLVTIRAYATAIVSERGIAFMLDLANQHGDGGARDIYRTAAPAITEAERLRAIENESLRRIANQFGPDSNEVAAGRTRRRAFRTSQLLSDYPFAD